MKKSAKLITFIILLSYFLVGIFTTGCSSIQGYTCPTYSTSYGAYKAPYNPKKSPKKFKAKARINTNLVKI